MEGRFTLLPVELATAIVDYLSTKPLPYHETAPLIRGVQAARMVEPRANPPDADRPSTEDERWTCPES